MNKNIEKKLKHHLGVKSSAGKYEKKLIKKARKYRWIFYIIPGILCVCIGNSVAMNSAHKKSDIDLFIITKKNRIWTVRILSTVILTLLGERKTTKNHAGKFCLSFFITEQSMNLSSIALKNDYYLKYWIKTLIPIVNKEDTFTKFRNCHISGGEYTPRMRKTYFLGIGNTIEYALKRIFLPHTIRSYKKLGKPFGVIISDDMLKFHDKDTRKKIRQNIIGG